MNIIKAFLIALSTYSIIPVKRFEWNEKNLKYSIVFFPFVGVVCGLVLYLWYLLSLCCNLSGILFSVVAVFVPLMVSGGIHIDGFMDTVDALSSNKSMEEKLIILKDSSVGAFSVIYLFLYLFVSFSIYYELSNRMLIFNVIPMFMLSRLISAILSVNLKKARNNGMLNSFTKNSKNKVTNFILFLTTIIYISITILILGKIIFFPLATGFIWILVYIKISYKNFNGVTGDTSGYFLTLFELAYLLGILVGGFVL